MTTKPKLAKKQKKVLDLLTAGKTPTEVAKKLGIGVNGVYGHMRRIEAKGYQVPRKGDPDPAPEPKASAAELAQEHGYTRSTGSTNGFIAVTTIDEGIDALIQQVDTRLREISDEGEALRLQMEEHKKRDDLLSKEQEALEARRSALAST